MMCIVRFPRSTIAAAVAVAVVVVVVGPRLCRGSKVRYLREQGHVVVVVVGCSTFKHHPTPTSYIKKHPTLLPLFQDQPHQRASDMRHKTTHICVHSALLVQSTLKALFVIVHPRNRRQGSVKKRKQKEKESHVAHPAVASSHPF